MNYPLIITVLSLGGSALIAFVTVQVSQKFYGKAILNADIEIKALALDKEKKSSEIAKLQTEVDFIKSKYVSKDEIIGLKEQMKDIKDNTTAMNTKIDDLLKLMINRKD